MTGDATRAVHGPERRVVDQEPLTPPIYRTATFVLDNAEQTADVFAGRESGWTYSRTDNPTSQEGFDDSGRPSNFQLVRRVGVAQQLQRADVVVIELLVGEA